MTFFVPHEDQNAQLDAIALHLNVSRGALIRTALAAKLREWSGPDAEAAFDRDLPKDWDRPVGLQDSLRWSGLVRSQTVKDGVETVETKILGVIDKFHSRGPIVRTGAFSMAYILPYEHPEFSVTLKLLKDAASAKASVRLGVSVSKGDIVSAAAV
jgi:hypothetical protein